IFWETTRFPPRTSTTSSVGISTSWISLSRPKALMRLFRLSATLRSNPEYVWMMYQSFITTSSASRPSEILQHRLETPSQEGIDDPQIESEEKDGGNDDYRRAEHLTL